MKILVTGKNGQVAQALLSQNSTAVSIIALGRPELDISDKASIEKAIKEHKPDFIINPAAYTAVDKAESEVAQAFLINRDGARNVAEVTADLDLPLLHISTDYVFNGASETPYKESDTVGTVNVYGLSKLQGEWAVSEANKNHVILRTAWVYSTYGNNFLNTMLRLAQSHDQLRIVGDQWGTPTSADFIAAATIAIAQKIATGDCTADWRGIFNLVADGYTNWAEFAAAIFASKHNQTGKIPAITSIPAREYKTPAKRPNFSKLDNSKIKSVFNLEIKNWQDYL
ncbi:dTDP-4-dehydrorhamnose reductase (plasmid) [Bartonella sp. HY329]|uniref:dTDP-4-dehydrorhamnose reductase n=1 Tax=unclassified Bartonella TaxID=2645622 RepID=UPI0021C6C1AE|nr:MULTISPECIES: dTDP-4-dehydrorhamnose reductase [unclassified Bartonella]UXM96507.1 dTDP-4-dehydrorhamnose reductase [Bartonella sp. HY329]UXN10830.1 dTDP-4-dehydrorhamnose reductase [Bartonella sp. HY328]